MVESSVRAQWLDGVSVCLMVIFREAAAAVPTAVASDASAKAHSKFFISAQAPTSLNSAASRGRVPPVAAVNAPRQAERVRVSQLVHGPAVCRRSAPGSELTTTA